MSRELTPSAALWTVSKSEKRLGEGAASPKATTAARRFSADSSRDEVGRAAVARRVCAHAAKLEAQTAWTTVPLAIYGAGLRPDGFSTPPTQSKLAAVEWDNSRRWASR